MSDPQRTHKATPKRVQEFRKRGDIALSRDVVSAATLTGGVIGLIACSGGTAGALLELTRDAALATDGRPAGWLLNASAKAFATAAFPAVIGAAIAAVLSMLLQLGWPPAFKSISFDPSKLSPISNLKNAFGLGSIARRTGAAIAKIVLVGVIVVLVLRSGITLHALDAGGIGAVAWAVTSRVLWFVLGALVLIAAVDYWLTRRKLTNQMMMTSDEVKREHKDSEGDPMLKGKRKAKARELAKRRIAAVVPTADVVVVNPTHYAVALRYDESQDRAPIVLAKGIDDEALRIREIARQHGVPVLERPPLARALHKHVKEGRQVPSNLYRAVAEVLAYVYKLRHGGNS